MLGQVVTLTQGSRDVKGEVKGLDPKGHLILQTENGEESFGAGEVSLKK